MKRPAKASKANQKDEDHDDKQARDKGKGEKWARMRKDGLVPDYILNLYDEGSKGMVSSRDFRTRLINTLFEKNDQGLFTMNTGHKMFTEAFKVYQKNMPEMKMKAWLRAYCVDFIFRTIWRPRDENDLTLFSCHSTSTISFVLLGSGQNIISQPMSLYEPPTHMHTSIFDPSDPQAFDRAVAKGDVIQFTGDDGRDYYKFRRMTIGQERGQGYEHGGKGEVKANERHFSTMKEVVMKLEWSFDHTQKQVQDCFQARFQFSSKNTLTTRPQCTYT